MGNVEKERTLELLVRDPSLLSLSRSVLKKRKTCYIVARKHFTYSSQKEYKHIRKMRRRLTVVRELSWIR